MIRTIVRPREADVGGVTVRRSLPVTAIRSVGPWVFFDHMGPVQMPPGTGLDVPPHPHINLATVTYLFEGELVHRDSLGSVRTITPGAINLMTAGSGIVHSERTGPALRSKGHRLHGMQLWSALPAELEETEPTFDHYDARSLPETEVAKSAIRVMIGEYAGVTSPIRVLSPTVYAEIRMHPGEVVIPGYDGEIALYLVTGTCRFEDTEIASPALVVFDSGDDRTIEALEPATALIIGGAPLGKRYMWWNFISSRPERIERAKTRWEHDDMGTIPGESGRIDLPGSDSYSSMKE